MARAHPHRFRNVLFSAVTLVILSFIGFYYWQDFLRAREIERELAALQQEADSLQVRKVEMSELLQYFDSESYVESRARLELGLVKPGERVVVLPPGGSGADNSPAGAKRAEVPSAPISAWWAYFFSRQPAR